MNKNKQIVLWVVIAIVVLAAASFAYYHYHKNKVAGEQDMQGTTPVATQDQQGGNTAGGRSGLVSDVTAASLTYTQAVAIFANDRIQFDENCRMLPATIAVKNGTTLMFDNRYREPRTFSLDGTRYTLAGYGFKLFELTASRIPHTVDVDCGTGQNTGTITLE